MVTCATTAFIPILWSALPNKPLPVEVIDSALQLPALVPALKIAFSGSLRALTIPILATINVLFYAVITIAPPAALVIRPMDSQPTPMRVPTSDLSLPAGWFAVIGENWRSIRPDAVLQFDIQEMLSLRNIVQAPWSAPPTCNLGCHYNITYASPVPQCDEYLPEVPLADSGSQPRMVYNAQMDLSGGHPVLDMAIWPTLGTYIRQDNDRDFNLSAVGTKCTFHHGTYSANVNISEGYNRAYIVDSYIISDDPIPILQAGTQNVNCPWNSSAPRDAPLEPSSCIDTRIQLNTWAFIEAFANLITGSAYLTSESKSHPAEVVSHSNNHMLLAAIIRLVTYYHANAMFVYDPIDSGTNITLDRALEQIFARSSLTLVSYGALDNRTTVEVALAPPFANRYSYTPRILWLAYAGALVTVIIPGLLGCYFTWKGFVLTDETTLAKVLVTTRSDSLNIVKGMSVDQVDGMVLRYEHTRASNDWEDGMGFTVVLPGEAEDPQTTADEKAHLLTAV